MLPSSVYENPQRPERWAYRVHIPALGGAHNVPARLMIQTQGSELPLDLGECLQFDATPLSNMDSVFGAYLLPGGEWTYFIFRKSSIRCAYYRLAYSLVERDLPCCLWYQVPQSEVLNRDYVRRAVEEVFDSSASNP